MPVLSRFYGIVIIIESKNGARASAMMYSIAETAKANGLNPFGYFQYLLDQLKEYPRNDVPDDKLKGLMPWSLSLPEYCKQQLKKQIYSLPLPGGELFQASELFS